MSPRSIAIAFGALIGLGALVLVVLLLRSAGRDKGPPPPPPLGCETLQKRAETCSEELAAALREEVGAYLKREGYSVLEQTGAQLVVGGYLQRAVDDQKIQRYCRRIRGDRRLVARRVWKHVKDCWPRRTCRAFTGCLRRLAQEADALRELLD